MKPRPSKAQSGSVRWRTLAAIAGICVLPILILAQGQSQNTLPGWWSSGVLVPSGTANDYAAVNAGQLKNIALGAYLNLQNLPGGVGSTNSGTILNNLITSWGAFNQSGAFVPTPGANTNDYAAVNLGQVKNVAKPFYDRLLEAGYQQGPLTSGTYPWLSSTNPPNDYAMANIGQVKNLFSFDVSPPAAPSNVIVTNQSDGSMLVTWQDNSDNAASFTIQESLDGGATWQTIATVAADTNSYVATGISLGSNVMFQVSASNSLGAAGETGSSPGTEHGIPIPIPQYAVIDMGTTFWPVSINNFGAVACNNYEEGPDFIWQAGSTWPVNGEIGKLNDWYYYLSSGSYYDNSGNVIQTTYADSNVQSGTAYWTGLSTLANGVVAGTTSSADGWGVSQVGPDGVAFEGGDKPEDMVSLPTKWDTSGNPTILDATPLYNNLQNNGLLSNDSPQKVAQDTSIDGAVQAISGNGTQTAVSLTIWNYTPIASGLQLALEFEIYYVNGEAINDKFVPADINNQGVVLGTLWHYGDDGTRSSTVIREGANGDTIYLDNLPYETPNRINNATTTINGSAVQTPEALCDNGRLWTPTLFDGIKATQYQGNMVNDLIPQDGSWSVNYVEDINDSGCVIGTANYSGTDPNISQGGHAVLLLPIQLTNKADPTKRNGANGNDKPVQFLQSGSDTNINAVAWIAASDPNNNNTPRMPQLQASVGGTNGISGMTVCWKLQVTFHDRHGNPHRDFDTGDPNDADTSGYLMVDPMNNPANCTADTPDQITIPATSQSADPNVVNGWHQITDGTPWNIYQNPDWLAAVAAGFFGGDAVLSLKIMDSSGNTIMPQQDYKFRIAGENPDPTQAENFINAHCGNYWYAYAIARQETAGEGSSGYYNHFLTSGGKSSPKPGKEGVPNWNNDGTNNQRYTGSGGYGLFQLTYQASNGPGDTGDANYIMPRDWIWNWQNNMAPAITKLQQKESLATNLYNWLVANFDPSIQWQRCPTSGNNQGVFSAYEGILIGRYNGGDGFTTLRAPNGTTKSSPWKLVNGQWVFTGTYTINVAGKL